MFDGASAAPRVAESLPAMLHTGHPHNLSSKLHTPIRIVIYPTGFSTDIMASLEGTEPVETILQDFTTVIILLLRSHTRRVPHCSFFLGSATAVSLDILHHSQFRYAKDAFGIMFWVSLLQSKWV